MYLINWNSSAHRSMLSLSLSTIIVIIVLLDKTTARRRKCPERFWKDDAIIEALMKNYTKILPEIEDAVQVEIEIHVQDVSTINEIAADFNVDILYTQIWNDKSLSFVNYNPCKRNITMESKFISRIWTPNTCIINAKRTIIHASPTDNIMVILYENGTIWVNYRITLRFESYSHNKDEVILRWMDNAITLMKPVQLPDFDLVSYKISNETILYPNGYWDQLQVTFTFKRRYGFYILQAYVPTYLTIIVSWVSFCMEPKALPARTTVGVSSLLALAFQFGNILKNLPRVSYIKAMDVWMLSCITFVFCTVVELAFVCFLSRCFGGNLKKKMTKKRQRRRQKRQQNDQSQQQLWFQSSSSNLNGICHPNDCAFSSKSSQEQATSSTILRKSPSPSMQNLTQNFTSRTIEEPFISQKIICNSNQYPVKRNLLSINIRPETVDKLSLICFPLAFTLFNLVYWCYYLLCTFEYTGK
uniref:Uncharacterized protein n=2 Tax=Onchocerca TaxID=6281 RepID=A0A8R1XN20_ONCVO